MGYSDIGCYGGEIPTPNIDAFANEGIRFTRFYNTSRCCPTRASLLTGLYPHETGIGNMTSEGPFDFEYGEEGYRGNLNQHCVRLAEILQAEGYNTYMTGKWHVGSDLENRPLQRGFKKYYGSLRGAFNYFKPGDKYLDGNDLLEQPETHPNTTPRMPLPIPPVHGYQEIRKRNHSFFIWHIIHRTGDPFTPRTQMSINS